MTVTVYKSTDSGAPILYGLAWSLLNLLDKILVDGYGSKSSLGWAKAFTSLVCSGTATGGSTTTLIDTATNFVTAGVVVGYQVFRTADGKNARVTSITTTTNPNDTLNFTAVSPVTPTFANTDAYTVDNNKRAYRQIAGTNQYYLRVTDDGTGAANYARARGYETMSDIDTGTGPFPTDAQVSGGLYAIKSANVGSTARPWRCISDGKIFYLFFNQDSASDWNAATGLFFGDYKTYKTGDIYNTLLCSSNSTAASGFAFGRVDASQTGKYKARTYAGTGGSLAFYVWTLTYTLFNAAFLSVGYITYPDPVSGSLLMTPILFCENNALLVGHFPGLWNSLHPLTSFNDGDIFSGAVGALSGKNFEFWKCTGGLATCGIIVETSNTWS